MSLCATGRCVLSTCVRTSAPSGQARSQAGMINPHHALYYLHPNSTKRTGISLIDATFFAQPPPIPDSRSPNDRIFRSEASRAVLRRHSLVHSARHADCGKGNPTLFLSTAYWISSSPSLRSADTLPTTCAYLAKAFPFSHISVLGSLL